MTSTESTRWTKEQKSVVIASFLGWTLDAFDFFVMVFVFNDIAKEFNTTFLAVSFATTLTLGARFIGAFLFGRAADRFGRRPVLMANVLMYSIFAFASGFSPNLMTLLVLRTLFGIAMGGEWGIGASLTMETIPAKSRGFVSGLLQCGYPTGYLLASLVYRTLYANDLIGWRGMIMMGAIPALLVLYIRRNVPESPGWQPRHDIVGDTLDVVRNHWKLAIYAVILMMAFNFFSHGTQDTYPNFLEQQHKFDAQVRGNIAIVYNIGAILGGLTFGAFSQRIGRRRAIVIAALLALPVLPFWAFASAPPIVFASTPVMLAIGAFVMQFMVQGAWGVIPVHLNELSPASARSTFPGFVYQLGNFLASFNAPIQAAIAAKLGGDFATPLMLVAGSAAVAIALLVGFGIERHNVQLSTIEPIGHP